jgi:hypothetical protein
MTRIRESATPLRLRTPEDARPTEAPKATKLAEAAREKGFSGLSTFKSAFAGGGSGTSSTSGNGTAPSGAAKLSPNDLGVIPQDQGNTNACGTTSLANVMTHWGMPRTHEQIDDSVRAFDMFSAPDKLVEYARNNGMRAELKADASLDDIARMIDQGAPPIVLIDPDEDSNANLHYVTVTGYNRDESGKITDVVIADSAGGNRYTMDAAKFQQEWDNLKMGGIGTGLNNVMITAVPNDGRSVVGGDGQTRNVNDIQLPKSSFWSNIKSGFARGIANVLANVTNTASNVWNGIKSVGSWISNAASTVGNAVSSAASAVGNAVSNAASAVGNAAKKVWNSIFG